MTAEYKLDIAWYLKEYPDVKDCGLSPEDHYATIGRHQYRYPCFDSEWYYYIYPDVAEHNIDALYHYETWGRNEKRVPSFPYDWYNKRYPDVAAAGIDAYDHFRLYGKEEGRWYNPHLRLDHENISADTPQYDSRYESARDFSRRQTDIKAIAFHLPQFHSVKENDEWWGEGFTEWTNTRKSQPRFKGHYQPRVPHHSVGYYDLSKPDALAAQARMARDFGIHGFCFYHYWFSGRRILEKPVDNLLDHPEIDINFCLCWANENWTRRWDGAEQDVLLEQNYSESDRLQFIVDLERYLLDRRYICVDGRPLVMVYKPNIIPDFPLFVGAWRRYWQNKHGQDLYVCINRTNHLDTACTEFAPVVDAVVEFPPHAVWYKFDQSLVDVSADCHLFNYSQYVDDVISGNEKIENPSIDFYRSVMLGWDNSARRNSGSSCWYGFSLEKYEAWLQHTVARARRTFPLDRRFVFINAWNEWAEGTYLEPDQTYGFASLNATARALFEPPGPQIPTVISGKPRHAVSKLDAHAPAPSIGIHVHIYFEDVADEIANRLLNIALPFDVIVTTDDPAKATKFVDVLRTYGRVRDVMVKQCPNIGRDVGPFLVEAAPHLAGYDIVAHFHTKKSETVDWGDRWCHHILTNLLGSPDGVLSIIEQLSAGGRSGVVYPSPYPLVADFADWGGVRERVVSILRDHLGIHTGVPHGKPRFPVGNMFWARVEAIRPVLTHRWSWIDFEPEEGQIAGTLGHCIERIWCLVSEARGFPAEEVLMRDVSAQLTVSRRRRLAIFVHYSEKPSISSADLYYIHHLCNLAEKVVVVSNSPLDEKSRKAIRQYTDLLIERENVTADFGAWSQALLHLGRDQVCRFDELILANNSCFFPVFPPDEMFAAMSYRYLDFWSVTSFPRIPNSTRVEACQLPNRTIPEHLQSYFMVFGTAVLSSDVFWNFWRDIGPTASLVEVISRYETQLTPRLEAAGFRSGCYLPEFGELQHRQSNNADFNAAYSKPIYGFLSRNPFVKKKALIYAPNEIHTLIRLVTDQGTFPAHLFEEWL